MNLYDLHRNPESLYGYEKADKEVPELFWEKYRSNPAELKKREQAIARSPRHAYYYALSVLKKRFPAGEEVITRSYVYAYLYARNIIEGRFPEGEAAIATHSRQAYHYALYVLKGRFLAGEEAIAMNPEHAYRYARHVIKERFPAGEKEIASSPYYAYRYAREVVEGRRGGVAAIASDPTTSISTRMKKTRGSTNNANLRLSV